MWTTIRLFLTNHLAMIKTVAVVAVVVGGLLIAYDLGKSVQRGECLADKNAALEAVQTAIIQQTAITKTLADSYEADRKQRLADFITIKEKLDNELASNPVYRDCVSGTNSVSVYDQIRAGTPKRGTSQHNR